LKDTEPKSHYGWIIDKDLLYPEHQEGVHSGPGVIGPRNIHPDIEAQLLAGKGEKFRMFDDDDELYYEGRILHDEDRPEAHFDCGFEPLDDYGTPNSGCTRIDYLNPKTNEWETL